MGISRIHGTCIRAPLSASVEPQLLDTGSIRGQLWFKSGSLNSTDSFSEAIVTDGLRRPLTQQVHLSGLYRSLDLRQPQISGERK